MNIFNSIKLPSVKRNRFDLSHDLKTSFKMGNLVPIMNMEVLPGDRVSIKPSVMLRFMPLISPVMHRIKVTTHFFFVPNRLVWPEWGDWITGNLEVEHPYCTISNLTPVTEGSVHDYMGLPVMGGPQPLRYSPFSIAAYRLIYDEYYRDQNLQDKIFVPLVAGNNDDDYGPDILPDLQKRAWAHDYFTSCLPFAQKGDEVSIPLVTEDGIPVQYQTGSSAIVRNSITGIPEAPGQVLETGPSGQLSDGSSTYLLDPNDSLYVDVQAGATNINTFRVALKIQEYLERLARGGSRYTEYLWNQFQQKSSDARLQRPEYIGGSMQNMTISEVLSTAQSSNDPGDATVAVGQMAGHGISFGSGNTFNYSAEEHGIIIGLINVQPITAYQQGLHRQFTRFDKLDYAHPVFANIGEQEVRNKEIYANSSDPDGLFGYQSRYSEYKSLSSRATGQLRSTLSFWHLGRIFATEPALNSDFITADPDTRIFAVETGDHIVGHIFHEVKSTRALPRYGIPSLM